MLQQSDPDEESEFEIPEPEDDGVLVDKLYPLEAPKEVDIEGFGSMNIRSNCIELWETNRRCSTSVTESVSDFILKKGYSEG